MKTISGATTVYNYDYYLSGWLKEVKKDNVVVVSYTYDNNGKSHPCE